MPEDLSAYRMDALSSTQVPWFVELRVENVGKGALQRPTFTQTLIAKNGRGEDLDRVDLSELARCPHGEGPRQFNQNSEPVVQCRVFFVPPGQRIDSISVRNVKGNRINWKIPQRIGGGAKPPKPGNAGPAGEWTTQGKSQTVNWRRGSIGLKANIRPISVIKGKKADISDYKLDASDKTATPWYVTLATKHVGEHQAAGVPDFGRWTVAYNGEGQRISGVMIAGRFTKCEDGPKPNRYTPNSRAVRSCAVFLVPDGQRIDRIGIIHNNEGGEINWKVVPPKKGGGGGG